MEVLKNYWWESKGNVEQDIFSVVRFLNRHQAQLHESDIRHMRLYGNLNVLGLSNSTYNQNALITGAFNSVGYNVVQSMIDTVTQKIAKNRPRPMFLTDGGDWSLQTKAKQLNKFVDGMFYRTKTYQKTPMAFRDCGVFGSGFVKPYRYKKDIFLEKVFPGEIIVDEDEGASGNPRCMYQVKIMPREYAAKLWPEHADKIKVAPLAEQTSFTTKHKSISEQIMVIEAWHLPADEESNDGRHVICIENACLLDEPYKKTYFPIVKMDWNPRIKGYRAQGIAEQLTGLQIEINKILRDIQTVMHLFKPKVLLEMGSKVVKTQYNNEIGTFVWYSGVKPEVFNPQAVPQEWFIHLQNLYNKAYEIVGVSQLSAQSTKPAGLNSGKALREYNDIESERFILVGQAWEEFHLEIAKRYIDLAKEIAEEYGNMSVQVKNGSKLETITWKEVALKEDDYMMQVYPTNFLSKTPSGKLADITELAQAGLIDQKSAQRLLDFPDLEAVTKLTNAPQDDIMKQIEMIIEHGEYHSPEPFQDLAYGITMFQSAYLRAKTENVPEERLEMLRRWSMEADMMLKKAQSSMMQPQQPIGQAMPAQATQAPVNELLPQG